jgi:four helix bundle protein
MPTYKRFEDLPVWQESARLYHAVLDLFDPPGVPLSANFRNQLERAALSISNNIAEGFERNTTAELISFIGIARGSAGEVRSMVALIKTRPALHDRAEQLSKIYLLSDSCTRQLVMWAKSIRDLKFNGPRQLTTEQKRLRSSSKTPPVAPAGP